MGQENMKFKYKNDKTNHAAVLNNYIEVHREREVQIQRGTEVQGLPGEQ